MNVKCDTCRLERLPYFRCRKANPGFGEAAGVKISDAIAEGMRDINECTYVATLDMFTQTARASA